jgi:hypothetical protein
MFSFLSWTYVCFLFSRSITSIILLEPVKGLGQGLMAVHLLLLAVITMSLGMGGQVNIYSNCLGALGQVAKLPPYRIPTQCRHSDILKTILVNCGGLSFHREYIHFEAHQDNRTQWEDLTRAAQLNAMCNAGAKGMLCSQEVADLQPQEAFPLKLILICMFVKGKKYF